MIRSIQVFAALWLACQSFAGPAAAQLRYVDPDGRYSELGGPGLPLFPLHDGSVSALDLVRRFQTFCLANMFNVEKTAAAVSASDWGGTRTDVKIPFTAPEYVDPVKQWAAQGFVLSLVPATIGRPTGNRFRIDGPQCTLSTALGDKTQESLSAALTQVLGAGPSNNDQMMRKGKPNKSYRPVWTVDMPGAGTRKVIFYTFMVSSDNQQRGLMLAVLPPAAAAAN